MNDTLDIKTERGIGHHLPNGRKLVETVSRKQDPTFENTRLASLAIRKIGKNKMTTKVDRFVVFNYFDRLVSHLDING